VHGLTTRPSRPHRPELAQVVADAVRKEVSHQQLGLDSGVESVRLDLGVGDGPGPHRVRDTTLPARTRSRSAMAQVLTVASSTTWSSGAMHRSVRKRTMPTRLRRCAPPGGRPVGPGPGSPPRRSACERPARLSASQQPSRELGNRSGQHDTYGSALVAQPGSSQGRPEYQLGLVVHIRDGLPVIGVPVCAPVPVAAAYGLSPPVGPRLSYPISG
jgi:hypothetical protein